MSPWGRNPSGLPSVKVRDGSDTFTPVPLSPFQTQCCPKLLWDHSCLLFWIAVNPSDLPHYVHVDGNFRCHFCRCTKPLTSERKYPLSQILLTTKVTILHRAKTEESISLQTLQPWRQSLQLRIMAIPHFRSLYRIWYLQCITYGLQHYKKICLDQFMSIRSSSHTDQPLLKLSKLYYDNFRCQPSLENWIDPLILPILVLFFRDES